MKPTDEQFAQINAIEQECFHGSWTSDTLLSELNTLFLQLPNGTPI